MEKIIRRTLRKKLKVALLKMMSLKRAETILIGSLLSPRMRPILMREALMTKTLKDRLQEVAQLHLAKASSKLRKTT